MKWLGKPSCTYDAYYTLFVKETPENEYYLLPPLNCFATTHSIMHKSFYKSNYDGDDFSIEDEAFLFPHEALRRDFLLTQRELQSFDPWANPWKAFCFNEWFRKYLLVFVHAHHCGEEEVMFPFYEKLGKTPPPKQCADHKVLMQALHDIERTSRWSI